MRLFKFLRTVRTYLWVIAFGVSGHFSLFAAAGPPLRTGLWVFQPIESGRDVSAFEAKVRGNSYLSGVCLHIGWKDIEKESGRLDFSAIDKYVAALRHIGVKYELGIKAGADTPPFVYQQGAQSFETHVNNPNRPDFGAAVVIPVPWDPKYQQSFSRLIAQLGERYGSDPSCVSVVLTCANFMSKEMYLPKTPEDRAKWKAMGDYEAKLLEVYKKYTDEWAKAFPHQAISLHLSQVLDLPSAFFEHIIDYGVSKYPERFTIQNCQLTGRAEDTGLMSYNLIQKYQDRAHHGFQSLAGFAHSGDRMGSMEMAALNMVHADGEYWELWYGDGMNPQICGAVDKAWREAKQLGYNGYKKKLIANGSYRQQSDDTYRPRGRRHPGRGRRNARFTPEA
jgi:Beta-galactosidase